jgi:glucosamine 6-phosphate synthetase-like amidotransferase/phosphosugar isomerase protein
MCGIAGYSLRSDCRVDRTLAAQALLAAIAERGADAVGYAYRIADEPVRVHKQRSGAAALLEDISIPDAATEVLVHVRDYTKGHPTIAANNHPIRHGSVVGIHNGIIFNDDELFVEHGMSRERPEMTVDSEVIFALAERSDNRATALEELRGSMATAWIDERQAGRVFCARSVGRPLWIGEGHDGAFFASTTTALEILERYAGVRLGKREVPEGTVVTLEHGHAVRVERFSPDRAFEESPLPAVRAPDEAAACLARLAVLAA